MLENRQQCSSRSHCEICFELVRRGQEGMCILGEIGHQGGASNVQDVVLARFHLVEEERRQFCVASDA